MDQATAPHPFETDLDQRPANHVPLSPVSFLTGAARSFADKVAVVDGERRFTYADLLRRCTRLASALARRGVGRLDTVAILASNIAEMIEAHYAVPMLGAVLNPLNTRLDAHTIAFSLEHGNARVLLADADYAPLIRAALAMVQRPILVVEIANPEAPDGPQLDALSYDALLEEGDPDFAWPGPDDEWQSLCLIYTSGTTGDPKGAVYHHRGAYLQAMGNALMFGLAFDSVYLWTLPMFHCSGWSYPWAVATVGGTQVCLRRVEPAAIYRLIAAHKVTHMCGAPIVLTMIAQAPAAQRTAFSHTVKCATGGAAPPSVVLREMEAAGFRVLHLYGASETYGPSTYCAFQPEWNDLPPERRYALMARQGVLYPTLEDMMVGDPVTLRPVPKDGETVGEVMQRGNTVMKGYLRNPEATEKTLGGGWYRSGDLAVWHPDGYIEVKDRSKDIIISGGENISSLEVEEVLYRHPKVLEAAVVARPDPLWGETPCAFVTLRPDVAGAPEELARELTEWCRGALARFKAPKRIVFGPLPKTSTGKIQKFLLREQARGLSGDAVPP